MAAAKKAAQMLRPSERQKGEKRIVGFFSFSMISQPPIFGKTEGELT